MIERWCIVRDGVVQNVVNWDGDSKTWAPPSDAEMVRAIETSSIGDLWNGADFQKPVTAEPEPQADAIDLLLDKLVAAKALSRKDVDDVKAKK